MPYNRRYPSNSDAVKQLAVIRNPHSTETSCPKIPDGSETVSLGQRYHYFNGGVDLQAGDNTFLLFPGLLSNIVYITKQGTNNVVSKNELQQIPFPTAAGDTIEPLAEVRKWRCVSAGLKIRCTNSALQDEGSWTARRVTIPLRAANYVCSTSATHLESVAPNLMELDNAGSLFDIAQHSQSTTFTSGKLRDLSRVYFQLQDQSQGAHDMIEILEEFQLQGSGGIGAGLQDNTLQNTLANDTAVSTLVDSAMDGIIITINATDNTKINLDAVSNYEIVFNQRNSAYSYMSETANAYSAYRRVVNELRLRNKKACRT